MPDTPCQSWPARSLRSRTDASFIPYGGPSGPPFVFPAALRGWPLLVLVPGLPGLFWPLPGAVFVPTMHLPSFLLLLALSLCVFVVASAGRSSTLAELLVALFVVAVVALSPM